MATVKDLAAYVCDKLAGKVLIHRYDAYSTNSVYLKFDYGLGNSLRLSDHTGKAGLNYRFNIITTLKSLGIETSGEYPRFYYPPDMVDKAIADIMEGVTEKRGRYGEISIRFARWKRRQVGEHKVQRTGDPVDRRHTGHVPGPNGPGDGTHDHPEMLRREGAEQQQQ